MHYSLWSSSSQLIYKCTHTHTQAAHTNTQARTGWDRPWISVSDLLWLTLPHWTHKCMCVSIYSVCVRVCAYSSKNCPCAWVCIRVLTWFHYFKKGSKSLKILSPSRGCRHINGFYEHHRAYFLGNLNLCYLALKFAAVLLHAAKGVLAKAFRDADGEGNSWY